jgi:hypothetical protein
MAAKRRRRRSSETGAVRTISQVEERALRRELARAPEAARPGRWNADPDDVQRSVAKLVLALVEFLRKLMERQAIRRMEAQTLTSEEIESVGQALMKLEETVHRMAKQFGLRPDELNLDLGPLGKLS